LRFTFILVFIVACAAVAEWNSVIVPDITRIDLEFFNDNGYDIETVFQPSKVRLYVNEEQEATLQNMGYRVYREETPAPNVAYPTITEVYASMNAVVTSHPGIARIEQIGTSVQGRELYAVVVSDNVNDNEAEPEIRITGNIHGDEKTAGMSVLNFLEVLTDNYGTSDVCTYVVDNSELWVICILNPDGYVNGSRKNANSVDLNRDFSYMNTSSYWQGPESVAIRNLTMQSWPAQNNYINNFATGLSFHSGAQCFNSVWNYSTSAVIQDLDFVTAQGNAYVNHPSIIAYYGSYDLWIPGASWYATEGDVNDWSYGEVGTVDHTIEVSNIKSDPNWPSIANANYMPMLEFCVTSTYGIYGTVLDGSGNPLDALIEVVKTSTTASDTLRFCRTDVADGGYSKATVPGTYSVVATVAGIGSQSQNGVVVGSEEMIPVNFVFSTGIAESNSGDVFIRMSVAPNPVTGACNISISDTGIDGNLRIYDISGRTVYEKNISAGTVSHAFNAGETLPAGVYQVRYASGGHSASTRMVVAD
jgi:hypothetical protein